MIEVAAAEYVINLDTNLACRSQVVLLSPITAGRENTENKISKITVLVPNLCIFNLQRD
jgi:hypothetical protein